MLYIYIYLKISIKKKINRNCIYIDENTLDIINTTDIF